MVQAAVVENAVVAVDAVVFVEENSPALAQCWASLEDSNFLQSKDVFGALSSRPREGVLCVAALVFLVVVHVAAVVVVVARVVFAVFELW